VVSDDSTVDGLAAVAAAQRLVSAAADVIHDLRFRHALAAVATPQEEGVKDRVYAVERLMQCGVPVGRDDEMRRVGKLMAERREGRFDRLERCHVRAAATRFAPAKEGRKRRATRREVRHEYEFTANVYNDTQDTGPAYIRVFTNSHNT
jgi:hypothetical protein